MKTPGCKFGIEKIVGDCFLKSPNTDIDKKHLLMSLACCGVRRT